jgi:hypothetical protein
MTREMPGYIYLIMMADGVYKVGRTQQDYGTHIKRLKDYPGDSVIAMILKIHDDVVVEKEVLRRCRLAFGVHPRGLEYFKGPEDEFMKIIYECKNFTPLLKVPEAPKPPRPYQRLNSVEKYLQSNNPVHGEDLFVPLLVIEETYEEFSKHHRITPDNFREHCPLPIVRMEGTVAWKAVHHGSSLTFENPEVIQGASLSWFSFTRNSPLKAFANPKNHPPN